MPKGSARAGVSVGRPASVCHRDTPSGRPRPDQRPTSRRSQRRGGARTLHGLRCMCRNGSGGRGGGLSGCRITRSQHAGLAMIQRKTTRSITYPGMDMSGYAMVLLTRDASAPKHFAGWPYQTSMLRVSYRLVRHRPVLFLDMSRGVALYCILSPKVGESAGLVGGGVVISSVIVWPVL